MKIEYKSSVNTSAGHRSVYIIASATQLSEKRIVVDNVLTIDGETPKDAMSRTGAKRQQYNGLYYADAEIGKKKNISTLFRVLEA